MRIMHSEEARLGSRPSIPCAYDMSMHTAQPMGQGVEYASPRAPRSRKVCTLDLVTRASTDDMWVSGQLHG